jgi:hypothetical protein
VVEALWTYNIQFLIFLFRKMGILRVKEVKTKLGKTETWKHITEENE